MKNKLMQLFIENNAAKGRKFEIKNNHEGEATVYLYDAIGGFWGVDASDFVKEIAGIDAQTIHLRINSPGGDVFDGRAIQTALRQHPAKVVAHVDGLAASAATYVALGADEVEISEGAFFMIHKGWTMQIGNADDMRESAQLLDKVDESISADYQRKTGASVEQIEQWMADETWFSAQEALDQGFVDRIYEGETVENSAFNLAAYANAPKALTEPKPKPQNSPDRAMLLRRLELVERTA